MFINELEESITSERLRNSSLKFIHIGQRYLAFTIFKKRDLYHTYVFNEIISKELRYMLSQFEIIFRNKVNKAFSFKFGNEWLLENKIKFEENELRAIKRARKLLNKNGKEVTHSRLLAKLTFGFWVNLLNKPYLDGRLEIINDIFPRNSKKFNKDVLDIGKLRRSLKELNNLRNKVSHQEFILDQKYKVFENYKVAIDLMDLMNKKYYKNFIHKDNFLFEYEIFRDFKNDILNDMRISPRDWK